MKKNIVAVGVISALSIGALTLVLSNSSVPGDLLYRVDRGVENTWLAISAKTSKLAFGKYNLQLAKERTGEIKVISTPSNTKSAVARVYAASNEENQQIINGLLEDIKFNLTSAKEVIPELTANDQTQFSVDVAQGLTEIAQELTTITETLPETSLSQLDDLVNTLEDLDDTAVDMLSKAEDESDDSDDDEVSSTLTAKLERKLLKLREEYRIYTTLLQQNAAQITPEKAATAETLLQKVTTSLQEAESTLAAGDLKMVADIIDRTDDDLDKIKDLVKVEDSEESEDEDSNDQDESSDDDSNDDQDEDSTDESKDEDESEQEDESEDEEEDDDKPSVTPTPSKIATTSTPRPSKTPEPTEVEDEDESEDEEEDSEDEDVEGTTTRLIELKDILRNRLRI